jgi:hypothetical protein
LKPSTVRTRRAELEAAARMAVKTGVPVEHLDSLSALLAPDVAERILDAYWSRNGEIPKLFTIDLAFRFLAIAKETKCLDDAACQRLDEMWQSLEQHRQGGLTDKNSALVRQVLTSGVWSRVVQLPLAMMATARAQQANQPVRAAVTAQLAVAIAILTFAPVRLANLTAIKLGLTGRPQLELLARLPELRRQEPGQTGIPARAAHHAIDRRVHPRLSACLVAGEERGLVVPGTTDRGQRQSLVQRPDHRAHL